MDNKELNAAVNQLVELMDESFGLPGYKDYIKENFFMAVEVLKNSGNIYDLDAMVALSKALGMDVSYGFYSFVDKCCDDNMIIKEVNLQRPFAFLVYDMSNDEILFMGKVITL